MKIEAAKCRYRPIVASDQSAIGEILADWSHDTVNQHHTSRFNPTRLTNTVERWLIDAKVEPPEIPLKSTSLFRQALLIYLDATSAIDSPPSKETAAGIAVFVARGKTLEIETTAIHPDYRGLKLYSEFYITMGRYGFATLEADSITWQIPTDVEAGTVVTNKRSDHITTGSDTDGATGKRKNYSMTKAQWNARLDAPSGSESKNTRYEFTA